MTVTFENNNIQLSLNNKIVTFNSTGIQGLSAYQVALKNGFVGTEQEWLESLVHNTDMSKVVYDTNDDGIVDKADNANNADKLAGFTPSELPISVAVQNELNKLNNGEW